MVEYSDKDLVQAILAGDKERFREILERFKPRVLSIVSNHIPRDKVEEVTQDVFVEIYKSLKNYKYRSPLENWISKISVRVCYKYWQSQERLKKHFQELKDEKHLEWLENSIRAEAQNEFENLTNRKEAREILEICMDSLNACLLYTSDAADD